MNRCGCEKEDQKQSQHSPDIVGDEEPIVLVTEVTQPAELSIELFSNSRLKSGTFSVCRAAHCGFDEMVTAVVGSKDDFKGYIWTLAREIRAVVAKRNNVRDKTPSQTPKKVGAFCVVDDGEPSYIAHACLAFSKPTKNFWELHESIAARGDLYLAFVARGIFDRSATPPFA